MENSWRLKSGGQDCFKIVHGLLFGDDVFSLLVGNGDESDVTIG